MGQKLWISKSQQGRYMFECPGCETLHMFVDRTANEVGAKWDFNGSLDKPTVNPSILVRYSKYPNDEEHARIMSGESVELKKMVCHSFIKDGKIQYLSDCTHKLAGSTVELPDVDPTVRE